VLDFGIFPASAPLAQVLIETLGSPTGYGSRGLSGCELGNLWDVPILSLDSLQDVEVTALMGTICLSPPSWLLHRGADVLLTMGFRGGFECSEAGWASASTWPATSDRHGFGPLTGGTAATLGRGVGFSRSGGGSGEGQLTEGGQRRRPRPAVVARIRPGIRGHNMPRPAPGRPCPQPYDRRACTGQ
jgi:hypothetical protein